MYKNETVLIFVITRAIIKTNTSSFVLIYKSSHYRQTESTQLRKLVKRYFTFDLAETGAEEFPNLGRRYQRILVF
jgi:hypothetical protein